MFLATLFERYIYISYNKDLLQTLRPGNTFLQNCFLPAFYICTSLKHSKILKQIITLMPYIIGQSLHSMRYCITDILTFHLAVSECITIAVTCRLIPKSYLLFFLMVESSGVKSSEWPQAGR